MFYLKPVLGFPYEFQRRLVQRKKKENCNEKYKKGTLKLVAYQCIYILKASYVSVGWFKKAIKK